MSWKSNAIPGRVRRTAVIATVGLGLSLSLVLVFGDHFDRAAHPLPPQLDQSNSPSAGASSTGGPLLGERALADLNAPKTGARRFVDEHFGEVRERGAFVSALEDVGLDIGKLEAPRPWEEMESLMPSWFEFSESEREKKLEQLIDWPKEGLTNAWLNRHFRMTRDLVDSELLVLQLEGEQHYLPIRTAAATYLDILESAFVRNVENGDYRHSPFIPWPRGAPDDGGKSEHITMRIGQGWVVSASVNESHDSALVGTHATLDILRGDRDHALLLTLRSMLD